MPQFWLLIGKCRIFGFWTPHALEGVFCRQIARSEYLRPSRWRNACCTTNYGNCGACRLDSNDCRIQGISGRRAFVVVVASFWAIIRILKRMRTNRDQTSENAKGNQYIANASVAPLDDRAEQKFRAEI